jgi:hypothetical protein
VRILLFVVLAAACTPSAGVDAGVDARADSGPPGLPLAQPAALPITQSDVLRLGPGLMLDATSAFSVASDGSVAFVYESFDSGFAYGELWRTDSPDGRSFPLPRPTPFTTHPYEASPSFVDGSLYFFAADDLVAAPLLLRASVGTASELLPVSGVATLFSWPRLYRWNASIAIAFRDAASHAMIAWGADAASFGSPMVVESTAIAMAAIGVFGDGTLAYAYQQPVGAEPMVSFVRRSSDGTAWSDAVRVTDSSSDVHDTMLVARSDGGLDLYYVYPGSAGFVLFRRALAEDGRMGVEERVTVDAIGEPSKPEGLRFGGRVLLAFANITERSTSGEPTRQEIALASLPSEAPAP